MKTSMSYDNGDDDREGALADNALKRASAFKNRGELPDDFQAQLCHIFLQDAPLHLEAMRVALTNSDAEALAREAHTLKSSCALMGAADMAQLCETMEAKSESGSLNGIAAQVGELEAQWRQVRAHLERQSTGRKAKSA